MNFIPGKGISPRGGFILLSRSRIGEVAVGGGGIIYG